jgi:hypothetical protein
MALPNTLCFLLQILLGRAFIDHAVAFNPLPQGLGMELLMSIKHVDKLLNQAVEKPCSSRIIIVWRDGRM